MKNINYVNDKVSFAHNLSSFDILNLNICFQFQLLIFNFPVNSSQYIVDKLISIPCKIIKSLMFESNNGFTMSAEKYQWY